MKRNSAVIQRLTGRVKKDDRKDDKEGVVEIFARYFGVNKSSVKLAVRVVLVALSLASAHYSGFMSHVPFELVSIIAVDLLPSFISVFAFYFILCYSIARVFAFAIAQFYASFFHMLAAIALRLRRHWPERFGRVGVKVYKEAIHYEPVLYWFFCFLILLFVFNFAYLGFKYSAVSIFSLVLGAGMVVALVFKAGFFARSPLVVVKRLFNAKRVALRRAVLKSCLYFLTGGALALSFYTGYIRFDKVRGEDEVYLEVGGFSGKVNVVMSSNGSFVALDQKTTPETFYFLNDKLMVVLEDKKKEERAESEVVLE